VTSDKPAYPTPVPCSSSGISARDWFAGMALPALITESPASDDAIIAQAAYDIAEEMVKQQQTRQG